MSETRDIQQNQKPIYLLISNGELSLCLLVLVGKLLKRVHSRTTGDGCCELDICLGVFVPRLYFVNQTEVVRVSEHLHRPWYHLATKLMSYSKLCAFPLQILRRNGHILVSQLNQLRTPGMTKPYSVLVKGNYR